MQTVSPQTRRHLAVEDFGTGYSSLSYLRQFPIDVLKIDQSFVQQISGDPNDSAMIMAIIDMGKNLKQRVIAEGIATPERFAFLRAPHCAEGQRYLQPSPDRRTIHSAASGRPSRTGPPVKSRPMHREVNGRDVARKGSGMLQH